MNHRFGPGMFYAASLIEIALKCEFCEMKFTDVVKFVPDCGSSICGECYQALRDSLNEAGQYKCRVCRDLHSMPPTGLVDERSLMKLLKLKPEERALSEGASALRRHIEEVQDKINRLKSFDHNGAVQVYCDQLQLEVTKTVDSAVEYVNKLGDQFTKKISQYRESLLLDSNLSGDENEKRPPSSESLHQNELVTLSNDMNDMIQKWTQYFTQIRVHASDKQIERAHEKVKEYDARLVELEKKMLTGVLKGRFLKFKHNHGFFKSTNKLLGDFVEENSAHGNVAKEELLHTLTGHTDVIWKVLFLENGNLVSGSKDNSIRMWNPITGEMLHELKGHLDGILALAALHNGWLASGSRDKTIKIWDLGEKKLFNTLKGHKNIVISLKVLSNGNLASCSTDDTVKIWNPYLSDNNLMMTFIGHKIFLYPIELGVLSNGHLVTCSSQKDQEDVIRIWDPKDGSLVKSISTKAQSARSLLVLSNDCLAVGFKSSRIKIIDPNEEEDTERILKTYKGEVWALLELPNGCLLSSGFFCNSTIEFWNRDSGRLIQSISTNHTDGVISLSISADKKLIASASADKTLKIWSLSYE